MSLNCRKRTLLSPAGLCSILCRGKLWLGQKVYQVLVRIQSFHVNQHSFILISHPPTTLSLLFLRFSVLGSYPQAHPCVHDMLDDYYRHLQAAELHASLHQSLTAAVKAALKKARGKVFSFKKQLAAAEDSGQVQKTADMIMANVYRWVGHQQLAGWEKGSAARDGWLF